MAPSLKFPLPISHGVSDLDVSQLLTNPVRYVDHLATWRTRIMR